MCTSSLHALIADGHNKRAVNLNSIEEMHLQTLTLLVCGGLRTRIMIMMLQTQHYNHKLFITDLIITTNEGELTCGVDELTCGVDELTCGVDELTCGVDELTCGVDELTCGVDELTCGVDELTWGWMNSPVGWMNSPVGWMNSPVGWMNSPVGWMEPCAPGVAPPPGGSRSWLVDSPHSPEQTQQVNNR